MVCDPAESPFCVAVIGAELTERTRGVCGKVCEGAAFNGFHYDKGYAEFFSEAIAFISRLQVDVHIVVLDLTEIPVAVCKDGSENFVFIMEGETEETYFSFLFESDAFFDDIEFQNFFFPVIAVYGMEKIKIDIVGFESEELFVENSEYIFLFFDPADRQFSCDKIR